VAVGVVDLLEVVDVDHRHREGLLRLGGEQAPLLDRAVEAPAVGDLGERIEVGLLLRLGELRLQGVDALGHLREQHVVAALLLDDGVLQLLGLAGDEALQLADVVDVGERAHAIGRTHQVDVERLGLSGELGQRLAEDLHDRSQLPLALDEDRAGVVEIGVAELQDPIDGVGQLVRAHPGDQRPAQPVDAGLEVRRSRRVGLGAPGGETPDDGVDDVNLPG
jgi:hypothetical protein